jgi:hypothetical protein
MLLPGGNFDHDVRVEDVLGEEDPEDIVEQKSGEEKRRNFQTRKPHEGDEGHAQPHAHRVHQKPVA